MAEKLTKAQQTRNKILDAALVCYQQRGIADTSLDEVIKTAGIGRTTLYRYIENREDLLTQVIYRDARQQQEEMAVLAQNHDDFAESVVESIVYVMRGRRTRPMNALLFGSDDEALIDRISLSPANFYTMASTMMEPLFVEAEQAGKIRPGVTLPELSQWVARIILSLVNYPEEFLNDETALRGFLQTFLVPSIVIVN